MKQICQIGVRCYVKYYERNERHSYSEITAYIFQKDGGIEYVREIVPVLQKIHENMADEVVRKKMGEDDRPYQSGISKI